jgi:peptidoglycan/xylan/chitin deacetylase (PgdA/CDA1 family)
MLRRRLRTTARWLRSRRRQRALILGYHRVADDAHDPYGLSVAPVRFAAQLHAIASYATPVRLADLVTALTAGRTPHRAVAVTFDDGYADALHVARPLLEQTNVPATVFVTTGAPGRPFWWDVLRDLLAQPNLPHDLRLQLGDGRPFTWRRIADARSRQRLRDALYHRLRTLPARARARTLDELAGWASAPSPVPPRHRALTEAEVRSLADSDLVEIGAHGVTHAVLPSLTPEAQRAEIADSRRILEELLSRPVTAFSYPHGATSASVQRGVREAGYWCACGSESDVVTRHADPFALPRFWVPDWDGARFTRWLRWWVGR